MEKDDYHNFKTFFITAGGSFMISLLIYLYNKRKVDKYGRTFKWENILEQTASVEKPELL